MEENLAIDGRGNNVAIAGMCSSFFTEIKREKNEQASVVCLLLVV